MATKSGLCLLMILTTVWITNGLSTTKCDHDQLSNEVEQFTSCLNSELSEFVDQFLKNYKEQVTAKNNSYDLNKGCPVLQKHSGNVEKCAVSLTSSCLDDKATELVKQGFKGTDILCENLQIFIEQGDVSLQPKEVRNWGHDTDQQFRRSGLTSLVELDKKCNGTTIGSAFHKIYTCVLPNYYSIYGNIYSMTSSGQIPQHTPICSSLDNLFKFCAVENDCISSREMELIKHVAWRMYQTFMNTAVKIKAAFGSSKNAIDEISKTSFMYGNEQHIGPLDSEIREEDRNKYGMIADRVIDDFEGKKCKEIVAENSGTNQTYPIQNGVNNESSFDTGSFIGGMVLIVVFNVLCVLGVRYYKKRELQSNYSYLPWQRPCVVGR